jgi:hypothetical protein
MKLRTQEAGEYCGVAAGKNSGARATYSGQRLRTPEAAVYCGISQGMLRKYRITGATGGPDWIRLGSAVVYDIADLDRWLAENRHGAASVAA